VPARGGVPGSGASVAPSSISEGETPELNVRDDENLLELHLLAAELRRDFFPGASPRTFVTADFYQHEVQATALTDGHTAVYDLLAQYIVTADDLLLHHLRTRSLGLELHQARGTEEVLVARASVPLASLLSPAFHQQAAASGGVVGGGSGGRLKHTLPLISADGLGHTVGTLRLTMRMRRPMDHALVPFYRRFPELTTPPTAIAPRELTIRVGGCRGLRPPRSAGGGPPVRPYVFYDLYEYGGYETPPGSGESPSFASSHSFVIDVRSRRLRDEVRREPLRFTVLDDDEALLARTDQPIGRRRTLAPLPRSPCTPSGPFASSRALTAAHLAPRWLRVALGSLARFRARRPRGRGPEPPARAGRASRRRVDAQGRPRFARGASAGAARARRACAASAP
jgi:hypothetical protein